MRASHKHEPHTSRFRAGVDGPPLVRMLRLTDTRANSNGQWATSPRKGRSIKVEVDNCGICSSIGCYGTQQGRP